MGKKLLLASVLSVMLSGCEHTPSWAQAFSFMHTSAEGAEQFDFNWRLSGSREVAPLQIFSTADQLWLQFAVEQNIPAIFAVEKGRQIPLSYKRSEPYVLIKGSWQELLFRGAALEAKAQYQPPILSSALQTPLAAEEKMLEIVEETIETQAMVVEPAQSFALELSEFKYGVAPDDGTMRQALKRWAQRDGWVFNDQHWEVEIDLPIVSSALFSADFNDAVAQLMQSTALGARPLQACLYSNKVLRVIPLAQHCDPAAPTAYISQG